MGTFENDDALDWLDGLGEARDAEPVFEAIGAVLEDVGYLDASDCGIALAAGVVAASAGRPGPGLPDGARLWGRGYGGTVFARGGASDLAARAAGRVRDAPGSELRELWEESGGPEEWYAAVDGLISRPGR